ncbi:MAG: 5-methyltetrahydrofolate--homocysteine methyltransferase [Planctomycetota bacterium]|jgi:5-methyltetrahydrofolate--homocysteine methyltransferase
MTSSFRDALQKRVLVIDGAMGTQIHAADLDLEKDFLGLENCSEIISITRPDILRGIHEDYLKAGCDAVETNTFGGATYVLAEFGLEDRTREINRKAAEIARDVCEEYSTPDRPRFAIGSMGPGTKLATLGQMSYDDLKASYTEQALGLADGKVDAFAIETCQDPLQTKAALNAAIFARNESGLDIPIIVSVTMEVTGTMLVGTEMAAAIALLAPYPIDLISINCATGPREMSEHVRLLGQTCRIPIGCYPNAGLPQLVNGQPHYPLGPDELAEWLVRFVEEDGLSLVGGCCGTTPEHMAAVAKAIGDRAPVQRKPSYQPSITSIYGAVEQLQENSVLLVGERSNSNGSRAFREHLLNEDVEGMVQIGRDQVRDGSHVIDVCTAYVGRDEVADMTGLIERYRTEISAPLMIDSTETPVLAAALKLVGGRSIINSINLEDGLGKCNEVLPLAKEFGCAIVCLTIDEAGMAKTAEDKLRIARRLYDICTRDHGLRPEDLMFDVLTFTICTGNEDDRKLGHETLEGIRLVKKELPGVGLLLGLSNISFGLNPAARHALNSVYLHHAQKAGLTAAILHSARIEPLHKIPDDVRQICEDLIFDNRREGYDPLEALMAAFDGVDVAAKAEREIPKDVSERLTWRIVEGEKTGLEEDLDLALESTDPLKIINTDLLNGMAVVGDLFGKGEMQLPFVLRSAETMKKAVAHLEPHMDKLESTTLGTIVLATVRGDVHDIGKNLVDIILTNNGYTVHNIGIKQPIEKILEAVDLHSPDVIGLSGLLVKSTVVMRENLEELNRRKIEIPVLLGGAALTRGYVEDDCRRSYNGPLYYAKDAFEGLNVMGRIGAGEPKPAVVEKKATQRRTAAIVETVGAALGESSPAGAIGRPHPEVEQALIQSSDLMRDISYPKAPFLGHRLVEEINLQGVLPFVNPITLFQFQWGYRRKNKPQQEYKQFIESHVKPIYHELAKQCSQEAILKNVASYGYWKCFSEGNDLILVHPDDESKEVARFNFPRQRGKKNLCIADFFHTVKGELDVVALQVVSVGQGASEVAREWFKNDRYQDYLHLHGLSVEVAEGLSEYIHRQIRGELGITSDDARDMRDIFKQGYRGSRYSFGYPACPNLADQEILLDLLHADEIGIKLSDEDQLWPEQSTSAIVCHHPAAKYFTL